jgi:hypothetical protein
MAEKEYIERGAVLNAISALAIRITPIEENRDRFYHDSGWNGASVGARVEVGKTPAADVVEVRHGEWKKHFSYGCWHYDCPFCDDGFATKEDFIINQLPKYCSNCGAKMDGERKE